ncbi:uncharacterized protein LOC141628682 [Silene latifolia]|uniref:uncharacterized protein LOC141628682 n=1 Tax=Silene latifolia TaxID=37657 RepID=UPI003D789083
MARKESIEALDLLLRDLCESNVIFGDKLIVFGRDFRQVLPVVQHKSMRVAFAIWPQLIKFWLTVNVRARTDPVFFEYLLALGNGELQTQETVLVELPFGIMQHINGEEAELINAVADAAYPEADVKALEVYIFIHQSISTPINEDIDAVNTLLIEGFPGLAMTYKGYDSMLTDNCNIYPTEFINTLCQEGMSPYELILKENCPIILLRNLLPSSGL